MPAEIEKRILIVEDESIVALSMKQTLTDLGYTVVGIASTGPEAIDKAGQAKPDVILMDIYLKGDMDGISATEVITDLYDIPIIYLTAFSDDATLKRALKTRPGSFLLKPVNERELYSNIEFAIYKQRVKQNMERRGDTLRTLLLTLKTPVVVINVETRITFINSAAEELLGWSLNELINKSFFSVINLDNDQNRYCINTEMIKILKKGNFQQIPPTAVIKSKDSRERIVSLIPAAMIGNESTIKGVLFFLIEQSLSAIEVGSIQEMREQCCSMIDALNSPAFLINCSMKIIRYNKAFLSFFNSLGLSSFLLTRTIYEIGSFLFFGTYHQYEEVIRTGYPIIESKKYSFKDDELYLTIKKIPMIQDDIVKGVITIIEDTTEIEKKKEYNEMMSTNIFRTHQQIELIKMQYDRISNPLRNILTISLQKTDKNSRAITNEVEFALENLQKVHLHWLDYKSALDGLEQKKVPDRKDPV